MSDQIPTLKDFRPISSIQTRYIVGNAPDPKAFAYHQAGPTSLGARKGTLTVLKDRAQTDYEPSYVPGGDIPIRPRQPRGSIPYKMKIGAEAAAVPDLESQASQLGGDGQMAGVNKAQQRMKDVAIETADKLNGMMLGREKIFEAFLYDGTWNSGSTTLVGGDRWTDPGSDIVSQLQEMGTALNADEKLTLLVSRNVWRQMQANTSLRSSMPTDQYRLLFGAKPSEAFQQFGIDRVVVSRAAFTKGGSDYVFRDAAYLFVSTDVDEVIPQGEPVNPSAFVRLCEDLRPDGAHDVGRRLNLGDTRRMYDFYIRQGRRESALSEVIQMLYAECFVQTQKDKLIRYKM